jgi:putative chitinase
MSRIAPEWYRVLVQCQVKPHTAAIWSEVLAACIRDDTFSKGDEDVRNFIAQALYETALLERLEENCNYSAARISEMGNRAPVGSRWRSLVPRAAELEHNPRAFANACYGGRLGNVGPDDGWLYRGSAIPMITGKTNYAKLQTLTGLNLLDHPEQLREPLTAVQCGIIWWERDVSDDHLDSVAAVTHDVQGGSEGLQQRELLTDKVTEALA